MVYEPSFYEWLLKKRENVVSYLIERHGYTADVKFTCDQCVEFEECPFVFDPYNTNGACLAQK